MDKVEEEFRKVFGDMYLSESETALRVFEHGYKAGQEALRQALERPQTPDDLLRQSEREGWRYAKECEAEVKRLRQALEQPSDIEAAMLAERERIVDLLMIQHEAAKGAHNYWQVAANLIQADVASDT